MKVIFYIAAFFLCSVKLSYAQKNLILCSVAEKIDSIEITASMTRNDSGVCFFNYRILNLKKEIIFFDSENLFTSYFLKPKDSTKPKYISFSMNSGPSDNQINLSSLAPGKKFNKEIRMDSLDYRRFSFEVLYLTKSQVSEFKISEGGALHIHPIYYIHQSKKIGLESSVF